ncbi:EscU/YscU/HrcU family type III secretion system export apparatus switch protein [Roseateles sp. NT4]|uniref:EscU/YscU/HrcU family type III secretion system export apparatus switch protein n=1 Tax=Roseateles sp. NT4 TaxID=3453715 RepID=UPI003EE89068
MSANKRHKPTRHRLREARRKGDVVFSADVASTVVFVAAMLAVLLLSATGVSLLRDLWVHATHVSLMTASRDRLGELLDHAQAVLLWIVIPLIGVTVLAGVLGSFLQVGGLFAWGRLKPDVTRLSPSKGLQRIFSTRNAFNLLKVILKATLVGGLVILTIRGRLDSVINLGWVPPQAIGQVAAQIIATLFGVAAVIYAVLAGLDYAHQRYEHEKSLRMSIEELRREYKDNQGDPVNRARRFGAHFEAVYAGLADRVAVSSLVVHSLDSAVAIQYLGDRDLPRVLAKGSGEAAQRLREFAVAAHVPVRLDPALAEQLYGSVSADQPIPRKLFAPVAALLRELQG